MADGTGRARVLEVLGAEPPWQVTDEWLSGIRDRLRGWGDDRRALRPGAFPGLTDGTPAAVWYAGQVAPMLGGWIPVLHGDLADLSAAVTRDFHRSPSRVGSGHVVHYAGYDWPLLLIAGTRNFDEPGRRQALELSREVIGLFADAPPLAARARSLLAVFGRILGERDLTKLHVSGSYEEIVQRWRGDLLLGGERTVLPELAGPNSALRSSLTGLRNAHADLSEIGGNDGDFAQMLALLIRATGLDELPAAAAQHLRDAARDVERALDQTSTGFDTRGWLEHNADWLSHALSQGRERSVRLWAATATQVSVQFAGVLRGRPWPDPEIPDLGALFRLLDRRRETEAEDDRVAGIAAGLPAELARQTLTAVPLPAESGEEDLPDPLTFGDDPFAELDALIGLQSVKDAVRRMVAETRTNLRRKDLGLPTHDRARHMVFVGKPGTAKTTIARLLSRIYKQLGVLEKGHVVEVDRSDLVGSSVGATAPMTAGKFREALGGVLFVDEAYSLVPPGSPNDYGHEAIATLLKMMEDHRDECIVIVAGYHREMQRFMESNTGLASRFPKMLAFDEYTDDQLVAIFQLQARQTGMVLADGVLEAVRKVVPPAPRGHTFGNGRFIRNVLEEAISNQATRLSTRDPATLTERDLRELLPVDVKAPTSMRAEDYLL